MSISKKCIIVPENLPQNAEYEALVLAAIIGDENTSQEILSSLSVDNFEQENHKVLITLLKKMSSEGIRIVPENVLIQAKENKLLASLGGAQGILSIACSYSNRADNDFYVDKVIELSQRRNAILAAKNFIDGMHDETKNPDNFLKDIVSSLYNLTAKEKVKTLTANDIEGNFYNGMTFEAYCEWKKDRKLRGLPPYIGMSTGFEKLDAAIGGLQDGKLYYCGARTSMGKTTFMLNIASNIIFKSREKIGIISLEMKSSDIYSRLLCIASDVSFKRFDESNVSTSEREMIMIARTNIGDNFIIEDPASLSIEKLCSRAKRLKEFYNIKILFIDYLSRIHAERKFSSKHLEIDYISKCLQNLARELNIPIFVLAQLNRESAKKDDPTPCLTDFRESGSIEEDADACLLLHRPDYYHPEKKVGTIEVHVAKNRLLGTLGKVILKCDFKISEKYNQSDEIAHLPKAVVSNRYPDQ
jgi:replicative DNA helicase